MRSRLPADSEPLHAPLLAGRKRWRDFTGRTLASRPTTKPCGQKGNRRPGRHGAIACLCDCQLRPIPRTVETPWRKRWAWLAVRPEFVKRQLFQSPNRRITMNRLKNYVLMAAGFAVLAMGWAFLA